LTNISACLKSSAEFSPLHAGEFFAHVNVDAGNIHIPDGAIKGNYQQYCASYEEVIRNAGGIDLQILGIGRNGHIGFNEPTSSLGSRTRLKVLSKETIQDNRKFFASKTRFRNAPSPWASEPFSNPSESFAGQRLPKAAAIAKAIEGPLTASVTASALQLHSDVTFIIDREAGAELRQQEYYQRVLEMTAVLTPNACSSVLICISSRNLRHYAKILRCWHASRSQSDGNSLAENTYGSSRIHLLRVSKQQGRHDIREIGLSIRFEGDFEAAHARGDNRKILPADT